MRPPGDTVRTKDKSAHSGDSNLSQSVFPSWKTRRLSGFHEKTRGFLDVSKRVLFGIFRDTAFALMRARRENAFFTAQRSEGKDYGHEHSP